MRTICRCTPRMGIKGVALPTAMLLIMFIWRMGVKVMRRWFEGRIAWMGRKSIVDIFCMCLFLIYIFIMKSQCNFSFLILFIKIYIQTKVFTIILLTFSLFLVNFSLNPYYSLYQKTFHFSYHLTNFIDLLYPIMSLINQTHFAVDHLNYIRCLNINLNMDLKNVNQRGIYHLQKICQPNLF
jgi:hypothetical protein